MTVVLFAGLGLATLGYLMLKFWDRAMGRN